MNKTYRVYHGLWQSLRADEVGGKIYAVFTILVMLGVSAAAYYYAYGLIDEFLEMPPNTINMILAGAIGYGWYMLLNLEIDSEQFGRELRKKELDKKFGRLTPRQMLKQFGGESIDIPLGRVGKPEGKLKAKHCDDGLVGIDVQEEKGHVLVLAPTQSGKGLQLTQILEKWTAGAVVIDPKGEQYSRLVGKLEGLLLSMPHYSIKLSEFYGLNAPRYTPQIGNNLTVLYRNLMKGEAVGDAFWINMGLPLLKACWHYAHLHKLDPIRVFFDMALSRPEKVLPVLYAVAPSEVNQFAPSLEDITKNKMLMSGWGTLTNKLAGYQDMLDMIAPPAGQAEVVRSSFAGYGEMIFITFDFPTMQAQAGLVSAILGGITMNHQRFYKQYGSYPYMLMAIDELPTVAPVTLPSDVATLTGYNVRYLLYAQNISQLIQAYREEGTRSLIANCKYRAFYSANDMKTAEVMANMMGETIRVNESYSDRSTDGRGSDGSGRTRGERTDRAMTPSEAMNLAKDEIILQFDKKIGIVQRLNIIPKLKEGEYSNAPPPKRRWSRKRELTVWKLSNKEVGKQSGRPAEDEVTRGNLELIANCTTIEQLKHLWKVTGKPKDETEREAYRKRVEELKGNIGVSSGKESGLNRLKQPERKEDRRTDDDFF